MSDLTEILSAVERGDRQASEQLLPLVYDELRKLAARKLAGERPGQTLQPTALVHEAYLRLVGGDEDACWDGRGHFYAAAAEAMRRILVDSARRKHRVKHGGDRKRAVLDDCDAPGGPAPDEIVASDEELVALDDALTRLAEDDPEAARVVQLHFFAGLSIERVAEMIGVSRATAYRQWSFARAWLRSVMDENGAT
jgi:RNA polymerase sigma factor (TIGR02999 family)